MRQELIAMAKLLIKMASQQQRGVIHQYISSVNDGKYTTARIIADEVMDCFIEEDADSKKAKIATELYDKTMEFYEINS